MRIRNFIMACILLLLLITVGGYLYFTAAEPLTSEALSETDTSVSEPESTVRSETKENSAPKKSEKELLEEKVQSALDELTTEEKVLQMFIITPEALTGYETVTAAGSATQEKIQSCPVGGLIYMGQNIVDKKQVTGMLAATKDYYEEAGLPAPFLAVDEEGGRVARVANNSSFSVTKYEDMAQIGSTGDPTEARLVGETIGGYLSELGFNLDFAPVADVITNPENTVIGDRSFGTDPDLVAQMAVAEAKGLESRNVLPTLKHFPGHGSTAADTHEGYAYTDRTLEELMGSELQPFIAGIEADVPFIMAAHISVPSITGSDIPCSLSEYMLTDVLRGQLGYEGIIITDAMNMGAISNDYSSADAAVTAVQAGADIILMPADFQAAYRGVLSAVQSGEISEERIDESVTRILRVKLGKMNRSENLSQ